MQNRLFCASLLLAGFALPARAQLVLQAPNPIALHGGGGGVTFTLSNQDPKGTTPIPLTLTAGPIVDTATHAVIKGAAATLTSIVADAKPPTSIAPGDTLSLNANVTGISGASAAEFPILNGVSQLGLLSAFASDAALNVSIDGDGAAPDKSLAYTYAKPVVIALKNGDAQSYHLHWIFQINNLTECSGDLDMPLSGGSRITITPSYKPFSILDWVHPSNKKGFLLLSVIPPANIPSCPPCPGLPSVPRPRLLPARSLPVSLVMQPISPFWSAFWSYFYVVVLLLIGGLFSFLGSSMLPNMQRKGQLRVQLQDLANRTTTISTSIDSYLRVLLRIERNRIAILIDNAPAWIPASADPLVQAAASIDNLTKRLAGAERLDDLRRKHDQVSATAPPSVTDGIDANLQGAADQLHSIALSDTVLAAANGFFAKAQAGLDLLDNTDALAKQIAGNVALVMTRLEKFPPNYYADLKDSLPGVFIIADPTRGYNDAKNIVRPMLFAIDHGAAAIQLALDYAMVRASIPVRPVSQAHSSTPRQQPGGAPADLHPPPPAPCCRRPPPPPLQTTPATIRTANTAPPHQTAQHLQIPHRQPRYQRDPHSSPRCRAAFVNAAPPAPGQCQLQRPLPIHRRSLRGGTNRPPRDQEGAPGSTCPPARRSPPTVLQQPLPTAPAALPGAQQRQRSLPMPPYNATLSGRPRASACSTATASCSSSWARCLGAPFVTPPFSFRRCEKTPMKKTSSTKSASKVRPRYSSILRRPGPANPSSLASNSRIRDSTTPPHCSACSAIGPSPTSSTNTPGRSATTSPATSTARLHPPNLGRPCRLRLEPLRPPLIRINQKVLLINGHVPSGSRLHPSREISISTPPSAASRSMKPGKSRYHRSRRPFRSRALRPPSGLSSGRRSSALPLPSASPSPDYCRAPLSNSINWISSRHRSQSSASVSGPVPSRTC